MTTVRKAYVLLFGAGFALTIIIALVASIPGYSAVGICLAPGAISAALVFPQGIDSDWPYLYMALAFVLNGLLLGLTMSLIWAVSRTVCNRSGS